jgi:thymidylate synthase
MTELEYLHSLQYILDNGELRKTRNANTLSVFNQNLTFDIHNKFPLLTTKRVYWKGVLGELLWFIKGDTNALHLSQQGIHIWDGNSCREYLDSRNLTDYQEGECGPIYGYQWRHFNAPYDITSGSILDENNHGIDQLQYIIEQLKNPATRNNRRLIMSAWNPCQLNEMALPPCHVMCQFNVHDGNKLSCALYQRSVDVPLGSPFNIASYSFLTHILAKHCDLEPYEFIYFMGNCHIYEEHLEAIKEQIERSPYDFPTLEIENKRENINDYVVSDFNLIGYKCHETIKMKMVA